MEEFVSYVEAKVSVKILEEKFIMLTLKMIVTVLLKHLKNLSCSEAKHRKIVTPYLNSPSNPQQHQLKLRCWGGKRRWELSANNPSYYHQMFICYPPKYLYWSDFQLTNLIEVDKEIMIWNRKKYIITAWVFLFHSLWLFWKTVVQCVLETRSS